MGCSKPTGLGAGLLERNAPHAPGASGYVNFMSEVNEDRVRASHGEAEYQRLARIKAQYDSDNVFQLNANIRPA